MKKQTGISRQNEETLSERLDQVQGRARVNLIDINDLIELANEAEERLAALGIAKSKRSHAAYSYRAAGPAARSYKYGQGATQVTLLRGSRGWYVVNIERTKVYPQQKQLQRLDVTPLQSAIALAKFRATYSITSAMTSTQGETYAK